MKLNRISLFIALAAIVFSACNNTIKILAPYKDVTVVYGLLDQNDKVHYVRISKAFEGPGNAYTMAQQYDSIYYPVANITAVLQDSNTTTNIIVKTYTLTSTDTVPMPAGTFSYPKQLLYYTTASLNPNDYYTLIITNTKTGKKIRGATGLLSDIPFLSPNFAGTRTFLFSFTPDSPTELEWTTTPNARIYQMDIRFYYTEYLNGDTAAKSVDWIFAPEISPTIAGGITLLYDLTGQGLCNTILNTIPINTFVTRKADSIGVIFTTGSDDLNTYVQLSQPPTGINQDVPSFSDLENGIGLFTSRHVQAIYKNVDPALLDTLIIEPKFQPLNFQH
jgi:hypothetical protein